MHLYKAHLPIRHLLNNRDFEQSNPSTRTQMSALSFYEYIEIISAHCVNTWIMNFSTCGRWPTVDCTFSNGWYSRHVSNAHVSVCMCLNWLLFYLLVAFLWNQYTHRTKERNRRWREREREHIRRLKSAIPPVMYRRQTKEINTKKKSWKAGGVLCALLSKLTDRSANSSRHSI